MVYRLYCDNPPQVQSHTQPVRVKIETNQISRTEESHTSARNKMFLPSESLHGNDLQWKSNGGK